MLPGKIFTELLESLTVGRSVALCTLVETRGSTPQKAGALMLVFADGSQRGTLGGGCVEAEVKRRAIEVMPNGEPQLMTFHLDNAYGWDDGLICGGRMTMLVDPSPQQALPFYQTWGELIAKGSGLTEAVCLETRGELIAATRLLFDAEGKKIAQRSVAACDGEVAVVGLRSLAQRPRPYVERGISYLPLLPRCRLVIVGAGHVGKRVAQLASEVDFEIEVVDDRSDYCNVTEIPAAVKCSTGPLADVLPSLAIDSSTFCIIVTRGHHHDEEALFHLVNRPARYVGMIGSRRKIRLIFDDLQKAGISAEALSRIHAPLGLEIGSQTVPEIAVSIVAELIAYRNLGEGLRLSRPTEGGGHPAE